ncbi:MAG: cyclic nucleotide-binding domain-containing protein [Actinobacteria bacterium]|nr:cyclic nucleotide-binding domain-containing protein [Actinomycetota bacterium]
MDCASGDVVIRQGDPKTTFFVIGAGTFAVTVGDGNEVAELGPGDGFGEVALMQAVARTATVTARTRGRLLAIRDEEFLAAVTGSVDGHALAVEVSRAHVARDVRPRDR